LPRELIREFAPNGRDIHPDLLKNAAAHHRYGAATPADPLPVLAPEASGWTISKAAKLRRSQLIFYPLELGTDAVAQVAKPCRRL
jgi:hypothetical protein